MVEVDNELCDNGSLTGDIKFWVFLEIGLGAFKSKPTFLKRKLSKNKNNQEIRNRNIFMRFFK